MDEGSDPETVADFRRIISDNRGRAIEAHDIRTRVAGNMTFLEFHLVVPGDMTVEDAHGLCDRIEAALLERLGHASITIHVEPDSQSAAARGWSNDRDAAHQITTSVGVVALEIFEEGLPPRFRLWLDPSQAMEVHAIKVETVRDCGAWQRFTMKDRGGYVESVEEIPEPHTFTAYLQMGGETYAVDFVKRKGMGS
jgi:hypothetical protein